MGRAAAGVKGIDVEAEDAVIAAEVVQEGAAILTVTERGYGKQTPLEEYRLQGRGGKGIIDIKTGGRNGLVVGLIQVREGDDILLVTTKGKLIRFARPGRLLPGPQHLGRPRHRRRGGRPRREPGAGGGGADQRCLTPASSGSARSVVEAGFRARAAQVPLEESRAVDARRRGARPDARRAPRAAEPGVRDGRAGEAPRRRRDRRDRGVPAGRRRDPHARGRAPGRRDGPRRAGAPLPESAPRRRCRPAPPRTTTSRCAAGARRGPSPSRPARTGSSARSAGDSSTSSAAPGSRRPASRCCGGSAPGSSGRSPSSCSTSTPRRTATRRSGSRTS